MCEFCQMSRMDLTYTCRPTMEQCEEFCQEYFGDQWKELKEMGCKVVQATLTIKL